MRATSVSKAMPDLATISRVPEGTNYGDPGYAQGDALVPDDYGGTSTAAFAPVLLNVPCRIGYATGKEQLHADASRTDAGVTIYFPYGTDVRETDQISIRDEFFTVDSPVISPGFEIEKAVSVIRL
jgi:SPP1 family predicted phage head-tail adaptor